MNGPALARQGYRGGEPVRARADDDSIVFSRHFLDDSGARLAHREIIL